GLLGSVLSLFYVQAQLIQLHPKLPGGHVICEGFGFCIGVFWFAAGTYSPVTSGPLRFAASSTSGRCSTISIGVPEGILMSLPWVKSDTAAPATAPAPAPIPSPSTGWPLTPPLIPPIPAPIAAPWPAALATSPALPPCCTVPSSPFTLGPSEPGRLF